MNARKKYFIRWFHLHPVKYEEIHSEIHFKKKYSF